ncbi:MAG: hypothetical protein K2N30_02455 [Clostridia bacterium]|nr:hypothetical protein [Clostridia bacterium]
MQGNFFDEGKILWRQKLNKKQSAVKCIPTTAALFAVFIVISVLTAVTSKDNKIPMFFIAFGLGIVCTSAAFGSMFYTSGGNEKSWKTEYFITATRAIISANGGRLEREINLKDVKSVKAKKFFGSKKYGTLIFSVRGGGGTVTDSNRIRYDKPSVMKFAVVENVEEALKIAQTAVKQCQSNVTKFSTNVF